MGWEHTIYNAKWSYKKNHKVFIKKNIGASVT